MTDNQVMYLGVQAMYLGAKVAGPILLVTLVIGFAISLIQAVTQVQEMTLTFVPKVIAVAFVLLLLGNWMMGEMVSFTRQIILDLPTMLKT
ncbi:flagellar biosynthetic protein FliQ [Austwickia chelonae]|uniref:Flagellar biosynthetic protein FliQ n=1 Tax=Austwickia chelonae NBRC 105200 TaxID=1184607 RepID=K6W7G6_9MICO|nr:flagellar biosynthesis protein FliQ [Austwickia chelonae]GAB77772.1 flagellar biosynthetic protein FliQ [Austwickia chelonae NBRC 105200]SEV89188.1 flagellar biosynthetic protein FliQ [Austwickia chelonae]